MGISNSLHVLDSSSGFENYVISSTQNDYSYFQILLIPISKILSLSLMREAWI